VASEEDQDGHLERLVQMSYGRRSTQLVLPEDPEATLSERLRLTSG
jgi:hypothetical protein